MVYKNIKNKKCLDKTFLSQYIMFFLPFLQSITCANNVIIAS